MQKIMSEDLIYRIRNYHYLGKHKEVVSGWLGYQSAGGALENREDIEFIVQKSALLVV